MHCCCLAQAACWCLATLIRVSPLQMSYEWARVQLEMGAAETCTNLLLPSCKRWRKDATANIVCSVFVGSAMMHWTTTLGSLCLINHSSKETSKNTIIMIRIHIFSISGRQENVARLVQRCSFTFHGGVWVVIWVTVALLSNQNKSGHSPVASDFPLESCCTPDRSAVPEIPPHATVKVP